MGEFCVELFTNYLLIKSSDRVRLRNTQKPILQISPIVGKEKKNKNLLHFVNLSLSWK